MRKLVTIASVCLLCGWMISSCEKAIEENIGNSFILMSRSNQTIAFADTIKITGTDTLFSNLKDTVIQYRCLPERPFIGLPGDKSESKNRFGLP